MLHSDMLTHMVNFSRKKHALGLWNTYSGAEKWTIKLDIIFHCSTITIVTIVTPYATRICVNYTNKHQTRFSLANVQNQGTSQPYLCTVLNCSSGQYDKKIPWVHIGVSYPNLKHRSYYYISWFIPFLWLIPLHALCRVKELPWDSLRQK